MLYIYGYKTNTLNTYAARAYGNFLAWGHNHSSGRGCKDWLDDRDFNRCRLQEFKFVKCGPKKFESKVSIPFRWQRSVLACSSYLLAWPYSSEVYKSNNRKNTSLNHDHHGKSLNIANIIAESISSCRHLQTIPNLSGPYLWAAAAGLSLDLFMDLWHSAGSNQTGSNQIKPRASGYSLGMAKSGCFAGLCELTYICIIYTYFTYYIFILFRCCNILQT